jgi:hypothetical protein
VRRPSVCKLKGKQTIRFLLKKMPEQIDLVCSLCNLTTSDDKFVSISEKYVSADNSTVAFADIISEILSLEVNFIFFLPVTLFLSHSSSYFRINKIKFIFIFNIFSLKVIRGCAKNAKQS